MKIKLPIITISVIGTAVLYVLFHSRQTGLCEIYCGPKLYQFRDSLFIFPIILFFSVIASLMPERVFKAWWNFAKYAIPVSIVALIAVSLGLLHGGTAGSMGLGDFVNHAFDLTAMGVIYGLFSMGSLFQIVRGYLRK